MDKSALFTFTSGLYVVSADDGERVGACMVNTGLQVTSDPLQVAVTVNKQNFTEGVIESAGHFALAVVAQTADMPYVGRFGFRTSADFDKFADVPVERTTLGDPYTTLNTCAVVACEVVQEIDLGTHVMFVGKVADAAKLSDVEPLTYAYYHGVLKGKTPPKASSYIAGAEA